MSNEHDEEMLAINDQVLEYVYEELNELRELIERDREIIQVMQQLISNLQSKIDFLETALKTSNQRGKKNEQ